MDAPSSPPSKELWGWIVAVGYALAHILWGAYTRTKERLRLSEARRLDKLEERVRDLERKAMD